MGSETACRRRRSCRRTDPRRAAIVFSALAVPMIAVGGPVHAQQSAPSAPAADSSAAPLTLAQAIDIALHIQPQLTAAVANVADARERVTEARASYLPSVSPQYTYLAQYNYGSSQRFTNTDNGPTIVTTTQGTTSTTRNAELGAAYRLFDTGSRELNARQARQSLRSQQYSAADTRQSVIGNVADAYYSALQTAALLKVSQAQVDRAQNTLDVVQAQVEAGTSAKKDIYQAQADLANAKVSLLQAQNNAAITQAQLKVAIGITGGQTLTLADVPPPKPDMMPTAVLSDDVRQALSDQTPDAESINNYASLAYRTRPDLAEAQQNIDISQTSVDLAKVNSRLLVTSDVQASLLIDPIHFDKQRSNSRQVNLLFSYPLFDGGFARAQVRAAKDNKRATEAQRESLRQQVAVEVEQAYRNLTQARASLPAAEAAQNAAQINYDAAIESRREGVGSIVDVITAQTTLVQAQTNYVQAVYTFYIADERLARAVGQADRIQSRAASTAPAAPNGPVTGTPAAATAAQQGKSE